MVRNGFDFNSNAPAQGSGPYLNASIPLSDAVNISTDAALGNVFSVTLSGNRTLVAPTNPTNGQRAVWRFKQDGVGSRTISFDSSFRVAESVGTIVLSTTPGAQDYIGAIYNGDDAKWDIIAFARGI